MMSENFEKIVLEKLDSIDSFKTTVLAKLDNMDNFKTTVLEKLDKLDILENNQSSIFERLDSIENNESSIFKRLNSIEANQTDFNKTLNNLTIELKDTQEVVKSNRNILLKLETSLQDKVDVLFDYRSINDDKHNQFSKSIKKLQHKTFDHGIRISTLENDLKKVKEA